MLRKSGPARLRRRRCPERRLLRRRRLPRRRAGWGLAPRRSRRTGCSPWPPAPATAASGWGPATSRRRAERDGGRPEGGRRPLQARWGVRHVQLQPERRGDRRRADGTGPLPRPGLVQRRPLRRPWATRPVDRGRPPALFGSATRAYHALHERALDQAWLLGREGGAVSRDMAREAAALHYLTDAFAAGHLRTPAAAMREFWQLRYPAFWEGLQRKVASDTATALRELALPLRLLPAGVVERRTFAAVRARTGATPASPSATSWPRSSTTGTTPTASPWTAAGRSSATAAWTRASRACWRWPPLGRASTTWRSRSTSAGAAARRAAPGCTEPFGDHRGARRRVPGRDQGAEGVVREPASELAGHRPR